jgi:Protein of unknown function (DUF3052)
MPGYSGTPLPKKLGIKPGFRVQLVSAPAEVQTELREAVANCAIARDGKRKGKSNDSDNDPLDFALVFTKSQAELNQEFRRLAKLLKPAGVLWVSWPKKSSGVASDLDENKVRDIGLDAGLVDVKVCAITEIWSGLKSCAASKIASDGSAPTRVATGASRPCPERSRRVPPKRSKA